MPAELEAVNSVRALRASLVIQIVLGAGTLCLETSIGYERALAGEETLEVLG